MDRSFSILPLGEKDFEDIIELGNRVHGNNYLSYEHLEKILKMSQNDRGNNCSFTLSVKEEGSENLIGFRLTYAPGSWMENYNKDLSPELWDIDPDKVAYFKSNTLDKDFRGLGLGRMLLDRSIKECQRMGAVAGVTHIWMNSPGNSAFRYFERAGGRLLVLYPDYWNIDCIVDGYICVICGNDCHCTGAEMVLNFESHKEFCHV